MKQPLDGPKESMFVSERLVVSVEAAVADVAVFSGQNGAIALKLRRYTTASNQSMQLHALDQLLGFTVPALVQISGGFRANVAKTTRLH